MLFLVLLLGSLAFICISFVTTANANPYIRERVEKGVVAPPNGTQPPNLLILSPTNNTRYASTNVSLILDVTVPSSNLSLHLAELSYKASWQKTNTSINRQYSNPEHPSEIAINLSDAPEGPRWITVYAVAKAYAYDVDHKIDHLYYTTYYINYMIASTTLVNFTIDLTPPKVFASSMANKTYIGDDVPLNFTVNEPISSATYALDDKKNIAVVGKPTLSGLSTGMHNLTVYATDEAGNMGISETVTFHVAPSPAATSSPKPSPSSSQSPIVPSNEQPTSTKPPHNSPVVASQFDAAFLLLGGLVSVTVAVILLVVLYLVRRKKPVNSPLHEG